MTNYPEQFSAESETKKARYFSDFALYYPIEMRQLQRGGLLGKENERWRNVAEHCLTEAVGADILAEHLGAKRDIVVKAALLHDWYKRYEIETVQKKGVSGYQSAAEVGDNLLRANNISEEIIRLAHANIPSSEEKKVNKKRTLEEKIMHYIDIITHETEFIPVAERVARAATKPSYIQLSDSFRKTYHGKNLFEVQVETGEDEQAEFEQRLGLVKGGLISFIKGEFEKRIETHR